MKLNKKIIIKGIIRAESGIMVGGSSSSLDIGGLDKQIVRHPITQLPYIPGSSLKGKMRSLFEINRGQLEFEMDKNNSLAGAGPTQNPEHLAARLFGHIKSKKKEVEDKKQQASRIIVRDAELINSEYFSNTELPYSEIKAENSIDRLTSEANPRFFERVPKGAEFDLCIVINSYSSDRKDDDFLAATLEALRLLQDDYIGGSGSRGNGQVKIIISSIEEKTSDYYQGKQDLIKYHSDEIPEDFKEKQKK